MEDSTRAMTAIIPVLCIIPFFFTEIDIVEIIVTLKGVLLPHKWENCLTIDKKSWGYRRNARLSDFLTIEELIKELASTVSCGGNMLLNVGPTHDGRITPIYEERLRQMGNWLKINGQAIYGTQPWVHQNDTFTHDVWYVSTGLV